MSPLVHRVLLAIALVGCAGPAASSSSPGAGSSARAAGGEVVSLRVPSGKAELHGVMAGQGMVVVLLHAGVADHRSWGGVVEALAPSHRVIAYDRRGFGATTYEAEAYSDVDDLLAVLAATGSEEAILVGNSQGGRVAIDFALAHPERVAALVLVAPAVSGNQPDMDDLDPATAKLVAEIEAAEEAGDVDALNRLEAHLWFDGPAAPAGRVGGAARELFLDMNGRALRAASPGEHRADPPAIDRLGQLAAPVHVIVGELDVPFAIDLSRHIAEAVPRGTLTVMPGVAHLPQLEQPDAFLVELRAALRRLAR